MRIAIRLTFKHYRFELLAFGLAGLIVLFVQIVAMILLSQLAAQGCLDFNAPLACSGQLDVATAAVAISTAAVAATVVFPGVIATILGVQVIGREIERGTAAMPWTLGPSRIRWLLTRVAILAGVVGLISLALGVAADLVLVARNPGLDLEHSLTEWETRGWLIPARALAAFGIALFAGAAMGRSLPALLVSACVAVLVFGGVRVIFESIHRAEMERLTAGGIYLEARYFDRNTGAYLTYDEANAITPYGQPAFDQLFEAVSFGIPDNRSRVVVAREVLVLGGVFLAGLAGTVFIVQRRRPY